MHLRTAGLAVGSSLIPRHVARVFPACLEAPDGCALHWPRLCTSCRVLKPRTRCWLHCDAFGTQFGCSLEHFCCCRMLEIPDFVLRISCLECGQELVDPLPALVHEDRPIAESCLGRHSSFGSCDHNRPSWERWHTIFLSRCQRF